MVESINAKNAKKTTKQIRRRRDPVDLYIKAELSTYDD